MPGHRNVTSYIVPTQSGASGQSIENPFVSSGGFYDYTCPDCGRGINGIVLAAYTPPGPTGQSDGATVQWMMCAQCGAPAVIDRHGVLQPPSMPGDEISGLPPEVTAAYDECRAALSVGAFTACELMCRKILMHVAVDVADSAAGNTFAQYIQDLADAGYVTPPMRPWVDVIRTNGNEATHSLARVTEQRAQSTFAFTIQLLKMSYEMKYLTNMNTSGVGGVADVVDGTPAPFDPNGGSEGAR